MVTVRFLRENAACAESGSTARGRPASASSRPASARTTSLRSETSSSRSLAEEAQPSGTETVARTCEPPPQGAPASSPRGTSTISTHAAAVPAAEGPLSAPAAAAGAASGGTSSPDPDGRTSAPGALDEEPLGAGLPVPAEAPPSLVSGSPSVSRDVRTTRLRRRAQRPPVSICRPRGPKAFPPRRSSCSFGHMPAARAPTKRWMPASARTLDERSSSVRLEPALRSPSHSASRSSSVMPQPDRCSTWGSSAQREATSDAGSAARAPDPAEVARVPWASAGVSSLAAGGPVFSPTT
mmetsp:Transcript_76691/g.228643  ORF Transcript_76691/g.228643 Transcript_76691/m.228643 type:complete len:296 (+) Transcript_76691:282-1169(+)